MGTSSNSDDRESDANDDKLCEVASDENVTVRLNEGYYIFRTLRNSPAYLSAKTKDVFAMIRQLGLRAWFISLTQLIREGLICKNIGYFKKQNIH